jgi:hypothetical protein
MPRGARGQGSAVGGGGGVGLAGCGPKNWGRGRNSHAARFPSPAQGLGWGPEAARVNLTPEVCCGTGMKAGRVELRSLTHR